MRQDRKRFQLAALEARLQRIQDFGAIPAIQAERIDADIGALATIESRMSNGTERSMVEMKICLAFSAIASLACSKYGLPTVL